jgi:hypothetical protein
LRSRQRRPGVSSEPPEPRGDSPARNGSLARTFSDGPFPFEPISHSAGPVTRRPGQVACATPFNFGFRDEHARGRTVVCGVELPTSHGRGLIASRSDEPTVAVGFIPRFGASDALRRGATLDSGAVFSIVAARRRISWRIEPWLGSHGYHRQVAPRLRKCAA